MCCMDIYLLRLETLIGKMSFVAIIEALKLRFVLLHMNFFLLINLWFLRCFTFTTPTLELAFKTLILLRPYISHISFYLKSRRLHPIFFKFKMTNNIVKSFDLCVMGKMHFHVLPTMR